MIIKKFITIKTLFDMGMLGFWEAALKGVFYWAISVSRKSVIRIFNCFCICDWDKKFIL